MRRVGILTSNLLDPEGERCIWGGGERYLIELGRCLQDDGYQVKVVQAAGKTGWKKTFCGLEVIGIPNVRFELDTSIILNQAFNEITLDYDLRIYFATFLCWPEVRRPCIAISHGIYWDFPTHTMFNLSGPVHDEYMRRALFGFTSPDLVVAVDTNVRGTLAAMIPGSESKIWYIPNFVRTEVFTPKTERTWDRIRVLYPRRLTTLRGVNEFLKAAEALPEYDFYICGRSAFDEDEENLRKWIQKAEVTNVTYLWREMDQMPEIYRQVDISVIPTRAAEGTSLSCLESMSAGLPVITTPVGGLPNLIIDRFNGLLVDTNFELLSPYIRTLAKDAELRARLGQNARAVAVESFDIRIWWERWKKALEYVL